MVQTPILSQPPVIDENQGLTFDEFLEYDDGTDKKYELVRGFLREMPTATMLHVAICQFLLHVFHNLCADQELGLLASCDISVKTEDQTGRIPDVVINTVEHCQTARGRKGGAAFHHGETPVLAVEVVSTNWKDDYMLKHGEYAYIGIPEYWIVDPNRQLIRICTQPNGEDSYIHQDFAPDDKIQSTLFPQLSLTVAEILDPPNIEVLIQAEKAATLKLQQQLEQKGQQLEREKQRTQKLAALLREQGINPDELL